MDFKQLTLNHADPEFVQMLDGKTPMPFTSGISVDGKTAYRQKRDAYYNRLLREKAEFNDSINKISEKKNSRLRREEENAEKRAKSRYKINKALKVIAFLLPIVIGLWIGIDFLSNDRLYMSAGFYEAFVIGLPCVIAGPILSIGLLVLLKKFEHYYSRNYVENGVKFSVAAVAVTVIMAAVAILSLGILRPTHSKIDDFVFYETDMRVVLVEYTGDAEIVTLPEYYNGKKYLLDPVAFTRENARNIVKLDIPSTVGKSEYYGYTFNYVFSGGNLKDVAAPYWFFNGGGMYYGDYYANPWLGIKSVTIRHDDYDYTYYNESQYYGGSVAGYLFQNSTSLEKVVIEQGITSIDGHAFENCTSLETVVLPTTITQISDSAFAYTNIKDLTIVIEEPESDSYNSSYISQYAFEGCTIENVTASVNVLSVIAYGSPKNVTIKGGEVIPQYVFKNCGSLESVIIGDDVTVIGLSAFQGCVSLKSITIPENVKTIESDAFSGCRGLTEINFNATEMPDYDTHTPLFSGSGADTDGITLTIGKNVKRIPDMMFFGYDDYYGAMSDAPKITKVIFEDGSVCEEIGSEAFCGCLYLTEIEIPNSVKLIQFGAFGGCERLQSITLPFIGGEADAEQPSIATLFGYIFGSYNYGGDIRTEQHYSDSEYEVFYIPAALRNVTITGGKIFPGAFYNCVSLESITLESDEMTEIPQAAFYYCLMLKQIDLPSKITSIADTSFAYCALLEKIEIPEGVTSIGNNAFYADYTLTSIEIPEGVTSIGQNAFDCCVGLLTVTIPKSIQSIDSTAFANCKKLLQVYNLSHHDISDCFEGSPTIHERADDESIYEITEDGFVFVTIDSKVYLMAYIGDQTEITLPDTYSSYEIYTFAFACGEFTSVTIPSNVTVINENAFFACLSLTTLIATEGPQKIGPNAFNGCKDLTSVTFSNDSNSRWKITQLADGTEQTQVTYMYNGSDAAQYLTGTYCDCTWERQ